MRPRAEWAIDSEPIRARGIIVNYLYFITYSQALEGFELQEKTRKPEDKFGSEKVCS